MDCFWALLPHKATRVRRVARQSFVRRPSQAFFFSLACIRTTGRGCRIAFTGQALLPTFTMRNATVSKSKKIQIEHVFKMFGNAPDAALQLVRQGVSKQVILARTGQSIGVFDATFDIGESEIFVVMGLSGSGKSTLVRLLNRLIEPTAGRILVEGVDIAQLNDRDLRALRRKDISMVFQSFALMPDMAVLDNTALGLELAGVSRAERHHQAAQALVQVGLEGWGANYPDDLGAACSSAWAWRVRWHRTRPSC